MDPNRALVRRMSVYGAALALSFFPLASWGRWVACTAFVAPASAEAVPGQSGDAERLRFENERLRFENLLLGRELATLTGFEGMTGPAGRLVPATVLSGPGAGSLVRRVTIGRGSNAGFAPGCPVMLAGYVVGTIDRVYESQATVMLLTDPASSIRVRNTRSGGDGILVGTAAGAMFRPEDPGAELRAEDLLVTAPGSLRFPPNLPAGLLLEPGVTGPWGREADVWIQEPGATVAVLVEGNLP